MTIKKLESSNHQSIITEEISILEELLEETTRQMIGDQAFEKIQTLVDLSVNDEYFKLEKNEFRSDQITVNINTLAKEQQKIKVKAEVDGVEQEIEFTLIPHKVLDYAGAQSPFQKALDEAAKTIS